MTIRFSDITGGGIPYGDDANRPANPALGKLYSNGEASRLELYTSTGWQNIVQETPGVVSISGVYNEASASNTVTVNGTNFAAGAVTYAVGTNGVDYQASSTTLNSIVQLEATFSGLSPLYEPYDIKVVNPSNLYGTLPGVLYVNESPIWSTAAGSLGTFGSSVSVTTSSLSVSDPESTTITYSSPNLPVWLSLNSSTGVLTGTSPTVSSSTTYSFSIIASDGANNISRNFSVTVNATPVITGGTLASDSTYYYRTFTANGNLVVSNVSLTADILTVAGGGGSSDHSGSDGGGGGGGAGGLLYSSSTSMPVASYTVTVGAGGGNRSNGANTTVVGSSVSMAAIGGGLGGSYNNVNANSGGSGGGQAGAMTTSHASGTVGQGNEGGHGGQGSPDYGGGGGGGAGAAGGSTNTDAPGVGGAGSSLYSSWGVATSTGQNVGGTRYYAGGGGGGTRSSSYASAFAGAAGGAGGGGTGAGNQNSNTPSNGSTNTGGGAGGSSRNPNIAATGGSGIVIFRYLKSAVGG